MPGVFPGLPSKRSIAEADLEEMPRDRFAKKTIGVVQISDGVEENA